MKKIIILLLLIIITVLGTWMLQRTPGTGKKDERTISGFPWQIRVNADHTTTVFGITLDRDTLENAKKILGQDMEVALIAGKNETGSVEAYYSRYTAGVLSGRLILVTDIAPDTIKVMRARAHKGFAGSGAYKYRLSKQDLELAYQAKILAITFIPQANFDEEIILARFGKPAEKITTNPTLTHYLYPDKGLDLILDSKGKEVLQYVSPGRFNKLSAPLKHKHGTDNQP